MQASPLRQGPARASQTTRAPARASEDEALASLTTRLPESLVVAIRTLSKETGISMQRLMRIALHSLLSPKADDLVARWEEHGKKLVEREEQLAKMIASR